MLSPDTEWDHTVPAPTAEYPLREDGSIEYFWCSDDDLWAIHEALEQDDMPLPTDLMVAMIDRGLIVS
jgi:hypothetical protein